MGKVDMITQAEYARRRGVSREAVSRAIKDGRISLIDGKIDPVAADAQWAQNSRVRVGSRPAGAATTAELAAAAGEGGGVASAGDDYWDSRARREAAEAEKSEMQAAEMRGDLIRTDAVRSALAKAASSARDALQQIPARLSPVLAAETDAAKVHALLEGEIHGALAQLTGLAIKSTSASAGAVG